MPKQGTAPYGSWKSPITSDLIVQGSISLVTAHFDGDDLYWIEAHPAEAGRNLVMRKSADGRVEELTPAPYNVRTRVHEYGGGAFTVNKGWVYFSNFADNLLYVRNPDGEIKAITSDSNHRYADAVVDDRRGLYIGVREDHTKSAIFAETTLVMMNLDGSDERIIVSGNDFYSNPRVSPDGKQLAWLTWNHPNMPWDETQLWVAEFGADGSVENPRKVAGEQGESVIEPVWSPSGELFYVSDQSNWWNIYRLKGGKAVSVCPMDAEFGGPSWALGMSDYDFLDANTLVATYTQNGRRYLVTIDVESGTMTGIDNGYTAYSSVHSNGSKMTFIGASPTAFAQLVTANSDGSAQAVVRKTGELTVDSAFLSMPEAIEYPTENGQTAHAIYYAPKNPNFTAPEGEQPPLLVHVHGGPTGSSSSTLSLTTQYWTSRGFGVVDVNYGGSTGYGREYRERLKPNWGIVDVADSANAARYLVKRGDADERRLAIAGGSAGGYTTLASLVFTDVYSAGASHFGLSELEIFAQETHKFESRYMDGLLGPYPEAKDVYYNRSPINFTDQLSCPVIFFQGLDDKIVPPNQAELMVEALRKKGLPVAYVAFEGEGHGFRMSDHIKRALDGEFYFYSRIFGYEPAETIDPVEIANF